MVSNISIGRIFVKVALENSKCDVVCALCTADKGFDIIIIYSRIRPCDTVGGLSFVVKKSII